MRRNEHTNSFYGTAAVVVGLLCSILACAVFAGDGITEIYTLPTVISNSGSYILTQNAWWDGTIPSGRAIDVRSDDVTIDLNGFTINGAAGGMGGSGIYQADRYKGLTVKNGSVKGSHGGLQGWRGIAALGKGNVIENVIARHNDYGIEIGQGCIIRNCITESNRFTGIRAGDDAVIEGCTIRFSEEAGIFGDHGVSVSDCIIQQSGSIGILLREAGVIRNTSVTGGQTNGIQVVAGGVIDGCTVINNTGNGIVAGPGTLVSGCMVITNGVNGVVLDRDARLTDSIVVRNGRNGVYGLTNAVVEDCHVIENRENGIDALQSCKIEGNQCYSNLWSGIYLAGNANVVMGNFSHRNDFGIRTASGYTNYVLQNSAKDNRLNNYTMPSGAQPGPITSSGQTIYPQANFNF